MLTRFKEGASNLVWDIVTGDETWIYCYDLKTKQQSTVWVYRDEPKPTKVARERSSDNTIVSVSGSAVNAEGEWQHDEPGHGTGLQVARAAGRRRPHTSSRVCSPASSMAEQHITPSSSHSALSRESNRNLQLKHIEILLRLMVTMLCRLRHADWVRPFTNNDFELVDKERSGAPKKFEDEKLEELLDQDRYQMLTELEKTL
ncbi:hypothetical protein EVAR_24429_1 [Eumeta japonica]|uniref:Mariner Mos1 transposase n=1 Tax=Eumeta variegata TaxID=151549 RepID=A0A4C1VSL0_EUMVA|nr:hypothetical protein EVAR_24429_1 [Eumeta japonica]